MDVQQFISEVKTVLQEKYGLSDETADLLLKKYALEGFLRNLKDKYPLTADQTADAIVDGLISFYSKKTDVRGEKV